MEYGNFYILNEVRYNKFVKIMKNSIFKRTSFKISKIFPDFKKETVFQS